MKLRRTTAVISAVFTVVALGLLAATACATPPPRFAQVPEDGKPGEAAGRFKAAEGIAAEAQLPGHVFAVDQANARINEFTAWGQFVKAWGWKVDKSAPAEELQTCTALTECQAGSEGGGAGQLNVPQSIAVDGAGNVYVAELANHRVQKFDPDGGPEGKAKFLLTFGYKVNKTHEAGPEPEANLCTAASGDECQAGAVGSGPGKLGGSSYRKKLAASSADNAVFVGDFYNGEAVIQRFSLGGSFDEVIAMPKFVLGFATDAAGNLYTALQGEAEARKLKPHGPSAEFMAPTFPPEHPEEQPKAVALDGHGNVYAIEDSFGNEPARVQKYDPSGKCLTCGSAGEAEEVEVEGKKVTIASGFDRSQQTGGGNLEAIAATSACGADDAYVVHLKPGTAESFFRAFGEHPDPTLEGCEPPKAPPTIDDQYASSVKTSEAVLKGKINPHFWSGSLGTTTYWMQYASEACFEAGEWAASCVEETPVTVLPGGAVGEDITVTVRLEGLTPGTGYRYRFAAEGTGEPGEVLGVGGKPGTPGAAASFATFRPSGSQPPCPANEAFRSGPTAALPDCRAYEMVSPVDKEGGDIIVQPEFQTALPSVLSVSATSGNRFAYGSVRSFGGAQSAPFTTQYLAARREGEGWSTHAISPPRGRNFYEAITISFDTEFKLFSPDLCSAWLQSYAELPIETGAPAEVSDVFRRTDEECGGPAYQPLNTVSPPMLEAGHSGELFQIELQGVSEDGSTAVFQAIDELAPGGSPPIFTPKGKTEGPKQLYGVHGGEERFLCVLPGGGEIPWTKSCTAGGGGNSGQGRSREGNVTGALSNDATKVYWTNTVEAQGQIYLRENPFGEGAECSEAGSPCTLEVSKAGEEEAGTTSSQFWAAAKDGSVALFTTGFLQGGQATLYEYRAEDQSTHLIAGKVLGLMGQSADASRVYLASRETLTPASEENENEEHAEVGKDNLYLFEHGEFRFIAGGGASPAALQPLAHTARVSGDGGSAAFMSVAPLTGYDNTDAASGQADAEVFLYRADANEGAGKLVCASCDPSGARARGARAVEGKSAIQAAARIPVPENMFYPSRLLSEDGRRLFFESYGPLTPRDTNGQKDVYQWEAAGEGSCEESSAAFSPRNGGCLELISSGQSPRESSFLDASPKGGDVFFTTLSGLLPQDPGLIDVYDARSGGGLPTPPLPAPGCEGEACQSPPEAPNDPTPGTSTLEGAGNVNEASRQRKKKKHAKHKHKKQANKHQGRKGRKAR